ncbi:helix-turn-helix transcriptional regulator [Alcaligenes aquatilis]|uniref:helix-turn-helix domain-containing protein n=1 Tax=Alcaligenes aquatilis TaxID=323284 RepID=UPI000D52BCA8|nr:AraC family transcriptional regulator [Alcaligenes aquatilis]QXR34927.1 helix-turn-helix transcriptional regulator [Alcaligenes aquatilis]
MPPTTELCLPQRLSSCDTEPALRFEAWREQAHRWVDMLPLPPGVELNAELTTLRADNCLLGTMRSSAYSMRAAPRRLAGAPEMLVLTLIESGEVLRDAAAGEQQSIGRGALGLYDPWRMCDYHWSPNAREVFLALPRQEVLTALGHEPGAMLLVPPRSVLAPILSTQLSQMALLLQSPTTLAASEYATLLEQTRSMAMLMLHNLGKQFLSKPADTTANLHQGRYQAAIRLMERNIHRHELDATAIATGIGCSRTRLYAAFAQQNTSVMQTLREIRLQRTKSLIEQTPQLHLGALSWRCGFTDQSSFSKLFKARFHVCPSEWHKHVWSRTNLSPSPL